MIRAFLTAAAFLSATIALIVALPTSRLRALDNSDQAVSRAGAGQDAMGFGLMDAADTAISTRPRTTPAAAADAGLLASLSPISAPMPEASTLPQAGLEQLIVKALQQGQSEAYIDALVNDAAHRGRVDVPGELLMPDGRVDTSTLLSVLRSQRLGTGGTPSAGVYVVQPGDSLASIAYRFYGQTRYHERIYRANRDILGASDRLSVGMQLTMPAH